jgi:hypothetical protein
MSVLRIDWSDSLSDAASVQGAADDMSCGFLYCLCVVQCRCSANDGACGPRVSVGGRVRKSASPPRRVSRVCVRASAMRDPRSSSRSGQPSEAVERVCYGAKRPRARSARSKKNLHSERS